MAASLPSSPRSVCASSICPIEWFVILHRRCAKCPGRCEEAAWLRVLVYLCRALGMLYEQELGTCALGMVCVFMLYRHWSFLFKTR